MTLPSKLLIVAILMTFPGVGNALSLEFGSYRLTHHPDGSERPAEHGLRLDDLEGSPAQELRFDLELEIAAMFMDYRAHTDLRIPGGAWESEDLGLHPDPQLRELALAYSQLQSLGARRVAPPRSGSGTHIPRRTHGLPTAGQAITRVHPPGRKAPSLEPPPPL